MAKKDMAVTKIKSPADFKQTIADRLDEKSITALEALRVSLSNKVLEKASNDK